MSRQESPERKKAFQLWNKSGRTLKPKEIADKLGISAEMVRKWKSLDKWDKQPEPRRGAPKGNNNAKGNKGGGPVGNDKAVKHGLYRKFLPEDPTFLEMFDSTEELSPLEIQWTSIRLLWTNILWSLRPMHVTGKGEMIKELKKQKFEIHSTGRGANKQLHQMVTEEEYEFQFAWDRQATALNAQSQAMDRLSRKIKQYEEMLRALPPDQVQEEHRLRVEKLKAEIIKAKAEAKALENPGAKSGVKIIDDIGSDSDAG